MSTWVLQPRWCVRAPGTAGYCATGLHWVHTYTSHKHTHCFNEPTHMHRHTQKQGSSFSFPIYNIPRSAAPILTQPSPHHTQSWTLPLLHLFRCSYKQKISQILCVTNTIAGDWHLGSIHYLWWCFTKLKSRPHTQNLPLVASDLAEDVELVLAEVLFPSHFPLLLSLINLTLLPPSPLLPLLPLPALWSHTQIVTQCLASQQRWRGRVSLFWRLLGVKEGR